MAALTDIEPLGFEIMQIAVTKRRDNGSGIIRIPIATPSDDTDALTLDMLQQMVDNFASFPLVPVGVSPHVDFDERGGFSPAFIQSLELVDGVLWAEIDLIAGLFYEVVELGGWRGFSIEMAEDLTTQAKEIKGWVLTGGIFTNRPAVDAVFQLAASAKPGTASTGTYTAPLGGGIMADNKPAPDGATTQLVATLREQNKTLTAEKEALQGRVTNLSEEVRTLKSESEAHQTDLQASRDNSAQLDAKVKRLEAEARGMKDANDVLKKSVEDLTGKLSTAQNENLAAKVIAIRDTALAAGVPPAIFDGIDADPAVWMTERYTSVDAFETSIKAISGVSRDLVKAAPKSGHDPTASGGERKLDADTKARLRRMCLDPKYVGIKSEADLAALKEREKDN